MRTSTACCGSHSTARSPCSSTSTTSSRPGWRCSARPSSWPRVGPDPHTPQTGKVVSFGPKSPTATEVASGVPWVLDLQFGLGRTLYALSFGTFDPNTESLNLAVPNTGALAKVNGDGTFTVVVQGLNQPTSLQFIGDDAYVVTLTGEIWKIDDL